MLRCGVFQASQVSISQSERDATACRTREQPSRPTGPMSLPPMPLILPSPQTLRSALEYFSFGVDAVRRLRDALRSSAAPFKNDEFVRTYCEHLERCISLTRQLG